MMMNWTKHWDSLTIDGVSRSGTIVGFALGVVTTLGLVCSLRTIPTANARTTTELDRELFHQTIDDVLDGYVEPVDESELLARALKQTMVGLDGHSHFFTAKERRALAARDQGGRAGFNVVLHQPGVGGVEVVAVDPGSAATDAGLRVGDRVLAIRGHSTKAMTSQAEAASLLVGRVGERISVSVQSRGPEGPRDVEIELKAQDRKTVESSFVEVDGGTVLLLKIRRFGPGTGEQTKKALAAARRRHGRKLRGVILDLCSNPGGEVDEALVVADMFVRDGILTRTRGRGGAMLREEKAHAKGTDTKTQLVVLVDRRSASAAELLASALQDHKRATIVGEKTFGKGTVQRIKGLADGSVVTLTIARYFSPNDRVIDGHGIEPDVPIRIDGRRNAKAPLDAALGALGVQRAG